MHSAVVALIEISQNIMNIQQKDWCNNVSTCISESLAIFFVHAASCMTWIFFGKRTAGKGERKVAKARGKRRKRFDSRRHYKVYFRYYRWPATRWLLRSFPFFFHGTRKNVSKPFTWQVAGRSTNYKFNSYDNSDSWLSRFTLARFYLGECERRRRETNVILFRRDIERPNIRLRLIKSSPQSCESASIWRKTAERLINILLDKNTRVSRPRKSAANKRRKNVFSFFFLYRCVPATTSPAEDKSEWYIGRCEITRLLAPLIAAKADTDRLMIRRENKKKKEEKNLFSSPCFPSFPVCAIRDRAETRG